MPLAILEEKIRDLPAECVEEVAAYIDVVRARRVSREAELRQEAYRAIMAMTRPLPADFDEKKERHDAMVEKYGFIS